MGLFTMLGLPPEDEADAARLRKQINAKIAKHRAKERCTNPDGLPGMFRCCGGLFADLEQVDRDMEAKRAPRGGGR